VISEVRAEDSVETILDNVGFTNRVITTVETFPADSYNVTLYAEVAGYHYKNNLIWYKVGTSNFNLIFDGPEGGSGYLSPPIWKTFTSDGQFGLSLGGLTPVVIDSLQKLG